MGDVIGLLALPYAEGVMRGDENAAAMASPGGEPLQYLRARVDAQGDDFRALTELIVGVQVCGEGVGRDFGGGQRETSVKKE